MVESLEAISGAKLIKLTDAQREEFKKASLPVYKNMEVKIGKEIMQQVQEEIRKYRNK